MEHDPALEERIGVDRLAAALTTAMGGGGEAGGSAQQAYVPVGATCSSGLGRRRGCSWKRGRWRGPAGPPRELQTVRADAVGRRALRELLRRRGRWSSGSCASSRSPSRRSRRPCASRRRGCRSRSPRACGAASSRWRPSRTVGVGGVFAVRIGAARAAWGVLFSDDGATIDEVVARLHAGSTIATAESCTGGLMAGRLTDRAGSSEYVLGGLVVYSNEAKTALAGVPASLIAAHGAVSPEVATALSRGARERLGADIGIGITGVAGPGGGAGEKPVGTVCISVTTSADAEERTVRLPAAARRLRPHDGPSRSTRSGAAAAGHDRRARRPADLAATPRPSAPPPTPRPSAPPHPPPASGRCSASSSRSTSRLRRATPRATGTAAVAGVWRAVPPQSLHVTLAFLGSRPPTRRRSSRSSRPRTAAGATAGARRRAAAVLRRRARVPPSRSPDPDAPSAPSKRGSRRAWRRPGLHAGEAPPPRARHGRAGCARRRAPPASKSNRSRSRARPVTLFVSRLHPGAPATNRWRGQASAPLGGDGAASTRGNSEGLRNRPRHGQVGPRAPAARRGPPPLPCLDTACSRSLRSHRRRIPSGRRPVIAVDILFGPR